MNSATVSYCTFRVAGSWFGVPIQDVREVNRQAIATRIPHAPPEVAGYVNIRGHIFLGLDMAKLLGLEAIQAAEPHLILFKAHVGPSFGIVVDEIGDITTVEETRVDDYAPQGGQPPTDLSIERSPLITKVCRCPAELLVVLDPRRFLKVVELALSAVA